MDMFTGFPFCGAKATRATAQSITNNTTSYISFTATEFDVGGWYAGGNPTRLTVPTAVAGKQLLIIGSVSLAANGTGIRGCGIHLNGTPEIAEQVILPSSTAQAGFSVTIPSVAVAGDYYELTVYQSSGSSLNTQVSLYNSSLSVVVLG